MSLGFTNDPITGRLNASNRVQPMVEQERPREHPFTYPQPPTLVNTAEIPSERFMGRAERNRRIEEVRELLKDYYVDILRDEQGLLRIVYAEDYDIVRLWRHHSHQDVRQYYEEQNQQKMEKYEEATRNQGGVFVVENPSGMELGLEPGHSWLDFDD